jgi:hypothetical protein
MYMASNRPGGMGLLDIWVARRPNRHAPWSAPENLGEPVNSAADDFCPTPIRGGGLFFVSREALPASCGLGDIYFTRHTRRHGWSEPSARSSRAPCAMGRAGTRHPHLREMQSSPSTQRSLSAKGGAARPDGGSAPSRRIHRSMASGWTLGGFYGQQCLRSTRLG